MSNVQHETIRPGRGGRATKAIVALLLVGGIIGGALGYMTYAAHKESQEMEQAIDVDTIYSNIFINDIDVSGMTKSEALEALNKAFLTGYEDRSIVLAGDGKEFNYHFSDFDAKYDFSAAVEEAYSYARVGTVKERFDLVQALQATPQKITADPTYSYDKILIKTIIEPIAAQVEIKPVDATSKRSNGKFSITPSQSGKAMDMDATEALVTALLEKNEPGRVDIIFKTVEPQVTAEDLQKAQALIGTFTTKFSPGDNGRNTNIRTATAKINDVTVIPGEVFSTNAHFGAMTYDNGYRSAPVIIGGKLTDDMGGGVCQVSSTLYNALLHAELDIVERQNHSMKVGYVDWGFDATLAGDYIDLKFMNDTKYPVYIEAFTTASQVVVNIYGNEVHDSGRELKFVNALVETVPPPAETVVNDPALPTGQRDVVSKPRTGYKYDVYKIVYENGREVEKVKVNSSYYKATRGEVRVGTGPASGAPAAHTADAPAPTTAPVEQMAPTTAPDTQPLQVETPDAQAPPAEAPDTQADSSTPAVDEPLVMPEDTD